MSPRRVLKKARHLPPLPRRQRGRGTDRKALVQAATSLRIRSVLALLVSGLLVGSRGAEAYLLFDGMKDYVEVQDSKDFSAGTTGELTVAAWIRPDALIARVPEGSGYVYWMGKGERGRHEWVFRMYSWDNAEGRQNRISFYVFNLAGGLGVGSYFQDPVRAGEWIHVVGVVDRERTHIFKNGVLRKSDIYRPAIAPAHGTAPLRIGTRDLHSFFAGGIRQVRMWRRALTAAEVAEVYRGERVPREGLVAEYLLNEAAGNVAHDTVGDHHGEVHTATWMPDPGR
jgi:concanavalin A-like lectin/glucanase superfamily protein